MRLFYLLLTLWYLIHFLLISFLNERFNEPVQINCNWSSSLFSAQFVKLMIYFIPTISNVKYSENELIDGFKILSIALRLPTEQSKLIFQIGFCLLYFLFRILTQKIMLKKSIRKPSYLGKVFCSFWISVCYVFF